MSKGPSEACFSLPANELFSVGGGLLHRNGPSCPVTRAVLEVECFLMEGQVTYSVTS